MSNELVINVTSSEISIALLENKQLIEVNREKNNLRFSVGDIYLGRIKKLMPGLNAAFVDVGYEKDAFLHYLDLGPQVMSLNKYLQRAFASKGQQLPSLHNFKPLPDINKNGKIGDVLKVGQSVIVQIAKEPISTKGPRLTSEISLAGRNLVVIPFSNKVSVSQKIDSLEEKARLKKLIQSIRPNNYGVIVRTAAEGKRVAELDSEMRDLIERWENAFKQFDQATKPPKLVLGEIDRTSAILRDMLNPSFNNVHVNDETFYYSIREYIRTISPEKEKIVKLYTGSEPIFEHFGVEKQIKSLFGKTVSMKSGAYLVIEHTEALHVIDVNSGNRTINEADQESNAVEVNMLAAEEIARQFKLRDMGGIIVVDFIDMHDSTNRQKVHDKMKDLMARDRAKHHILPLSKFGLMQITRQRVRPETTIVTTETCPTCKGTGEIAPAIVFTDQIENNLQYLFEKIKCRKIQLKVHPFIAAYLTKGLFSKQWKWFLKFKCWVSIRPGSSYSYLEYHFFHAGEEIEI